MFMLALALVTFLSPVIRADNKVDIPTTSLDWPQWRGPDRNGQVAGPEWPERLNQESLEKIWRIPLEPSYSGPIVTRELVFTTETKNRETEVVYALDRATGQERWRAEWNGSMTVPFFAASNGSWIRSTPAYDGESLYVAGIRDVLVCLDAEFGNEKWRVDFVRQLNTPLPAFGFVSSPLVDGDAVFVQAGASVVRLNKKSGEVIWRSLEDSGGMHGSAFSSPMIAELAGKRQLVVQTREKLAGVDIEGGQVLWTQKVPAFRGMNILTPLVYGDAIFTSSYRNRSWLYEISGVDDEFRVAETWKTRAQGYMSTPVLIGGHAYLHLQSQRFTCINLETGERIWTSKRFGKYWSLVTQGDRILALDANGSLLLIRANPEKFELIDQVKVSDAETWAHLAVSGNELFIREFGALTVYRWGHAVKS